MARASPLLVGLVALVACRESPPPGEIRIAYESDALTLDPMRSSDDTSRSVQSNIYESLVAFDESMGIVPALAVSWNNPDERTWDFQLRQRVFFHDGTPFTAQEVKKALEFGLRDPRSTVKGELSPLEAIEAIGEHTLRLRTRQPAPFLLSGLAEVGIARADGSRANLAGTGPYRVVSFQAGKLDTMVFDRYWGKKPTVDRATFVSVHGASGVRSLLAGELDVVGDVTAGSLKELATKNVRIVEHPGLVSYYLWLDCRDRPRAERNPFADLRVRRAVSLAIDRKRLVARLGGYGAPLNQIVQKGVLGHVADMPELSFNPEEARRLLRDVRWLPGSAVSLAHGPDDTATLVADEVRKMLEGVGLKIEPRRREWGDLLREWREVKLPFFLAGWRENGDPTTFLRDCLLTRDALRGRGLFNAGYSNAELDGLIEKADEDTEMSTRLTGYAEVTRLVMAQMPVIPLFTRDNLYAVSTKVRWEPRLDGKLLAAEMSLAVR